MADRESLLLKLEPVERELLLLLLLLDLDLELGVTERERVEERWLDEERWTKSSFSDSEPGSGARGGSWSSSDVSFW